MKTDRAAIYQFNVESGYSEGETIAEDVGQSTQPQDDSHHARIPGSELPTTTAKQSIRF
ncbi:MAG: hypothetical protein F6K42_31565 [Leptolyngbya sp. SIO1D8]|nr:hypothetical protein [Leptolyngbya sp. SIO1D8]